MRILFIGEGRLGNQIFQYAALSSMAPAGARILAVGLEDLEAVFELRGPALRVLRGGRMFRRFAKHVVARLVLRPLARTLRLFSYACEPDRGDEHRGSGGELELRRGLFRDIVFVDGGYYQSADFWREVFPPRWLALRESWRERAGLVLEQRAGRAPRQPFFVHVRRGDYLGYSSHGVSDLTLPAAYFRRAIDELRRRHQPDLLVVVTDDAAWARAELGAEDVVVISEDPRTDFAVMAACAGGVISNSTFSLAAALFLRDPALVIAPEYWFGFRVGQWLPPRIRFDHPRIAYLPVPAGA